MPTAFVAAKPVPVTVTEAPDVCELGVNIMVGVAALAAGIANRTVQSSERAMSDIAGSFCVFCNIYHLLSRRRIVL
jgi:hypothetical protein